jgi:hypothetical protein
VLLAPFFYIGENPMISDVNTTNRPQLCGTLYIVRDTQGDPTPTRITAAAVAELRRPNQPLPPVPAYVFDVASDDDTIRALYPIGQPKNIGIDQARAAVRQRLNRH